MAVEIYEEVLDFYLANRAFCSEHPVVTFHCSSGLIANTDGFFSSDQQTYPLSP